MVMLVMHRRHKHRCKYLNNGQFKRNAGQQALSPKAGGPGHSCCVGDVSGQRVTQTQQQPTSKELHW